MVEPPIAFLSSVAVTAFFSEAEQCLLASAVSINTPASEVSTHKPHLCQLKDLFCELFTNNWTMGSAKQDMAIAQVMNLLNEWDKGSKSVRRKILQDFIAQNQNKTGPELEAIFAQAASLFLTRLTAWLRLTYPLLFCE